MAFDRYSVLKYFSMFRSSSSFVRRTLLMLSGKPLDDLKALLESTVDRHGARYIIAYPLGNTDTGRQIKYSELRDQARSNALLLGTIHGFRKGRIILLHFRDHFDNIVWFWSALYADCVPVMSTPFTDNLEQRGKHIRHLHTLLKDPLCLTRSDLLVEFSGQDTLNPATIESLGCPSVASNSTHGKSSTNPGVHNTAMLMLTSGSSGNAKAVCLSHEQVLAAIEGKAYVIKLHEGHSFLNWVGLDHVAGLIEVHLQAMYLGMDQIHVQPADLISEPSVFLNLVSRHRVSRSFAPNFFLARLRQTMEPCTSNMIDKDLDLSCLSFLASGGEANLVDTCSAVSKLLGKYGAPDNVIVPGFGMTETCAGAIFNTKCPSYDLQRQHEFASVGTCMPGIKMRVTVSSKAARLASFNEPGNLEVSGLVVFKSYYNDLLATKDAFTDDGWFKTGDQAIIDSAGNLSLIGRTKETMTINGLKYLPHELEISIEEAFITGATSSYTVCFSHRPKGSETEQLCVVYLPAYMSKDTEARVRTLDAIVKVVMLQTGARPYVLPLDRSVLQKSTLGKISRAKIRRAFECGDYRAYQKLNDEMIKSYRRLKAASGSKPANDLERILIREFSEVLGLCEDETNVDDSIFEMGITSVDLIKLKRRIEKQLALNIEIPMIIMLTNPTIRGLARSIQRPDSSTAYDPVVKLQHQGHKTPLWLVHPGVGEILVFLGLAKHMTDRPVYALRARGFNSGETYFEDINEVVSSYHAAIKATQPVGPYALAGYSYGTMLAFEIAKVLESNGDDVPFLGSLNLPPHIKDRMNQLIWSECLLHLAYFLDLITEQHASDLSSEMQKLSRENALSHIVQIANSARMNELSLTPNALANWANLAFALQGIARDYEPSGSVAAIDIFYAIPLVAVAQSKTEWVEGPLSKWKDYSRTRPRFHDVDGAHYTMIGPAHVYQFQKKLKMVLEYRGV